MAHSCICKILDIFQFLLNFGQKPSFCLCKKNRVVIKLILYDKYSLERFYRFHVAFCNEKVVGY